MARFVSRVSGWVNVRPRDVTGKGRMDTRRKWYYIILLIRPHHSTLSLLVSANFLKWKADQQAGIDAEVCK